MRRAIETTWFITFQVVVEWLAVSWQPLVDSTIGYLLTFADYYKRKIRLFRVISEYTEGN